MMKKLFAMILAVVLVLSMTACGSAPAAIPTAEPTPEATPAPTPKPTPKTQAIAESHFDVTPEEFMDLLIQTLEKNDADFKLEIQKNGASEYTLKPDTEESSMLLQFQQQGDLGDGNSFDAIILSGSYTLKPENDMVRVMKALIYLVNEENWEYDEIYSLFSPEFNAYDQYYHAYDAFEYLMLHWADLNDYPNNFIIREIAAYSDDEYRVSSENAVIETLDKMMTALGHSPSGGWRYDGCTIKDDVVIYYLYDRLLVEKALSNDPVDAPLLGWAMGVVDENSDTYSKLLAEYGKKVAIAVVDDSTPTKVIYYSVDGHERHYGE